MNWSRAQAEQYFQGLQRRLLTARASQNASGAKACVTRVLSHKLPLATLGKSIYIIKVLSVVSQIQS